MRPFPYAKKKSSNLSEFSKAPCWICHWFCFYSYAIILLFLSFSPYLLNLSTNKFLYFNCFSLFLSFLSLSRSSPSAPHTLMMSQKKNSKYIGFPPTHKKSRFAEYALNIVWKLGWWSRCYLDVQPTKQIAHESLLIYGELYEVLLEKFLGFPWTTLLSFGFDADFIMTNDIYFISHVSNSWSRYRARFASSLS